jgi:hypothetical protein
MVLKLALKQLAPMREQPVQVLEPVQEQQMREQPVQEQQMREQPVQEQQMRE